MLSESTTSTSASVNALRFLGKEKANQAEHSFTLIGSTLSSLLLLCEQLYQKSLLFCFRAFLTSFLIFSSTLGVLPSWMYRCLHTYKHTKKGKYHSGRRMGLKSGATHTAVSEANWHLPGLSQWSLVITFLTVLEIKTASPGELKHQTKKVQFVSLEAGLVTLCCSYQPECCNDRITTLLLQSLTNCATTCSPFLRERLHKYTLISFSCCSLYFGCRGNIGSEQTGKHSHADLSNSAMEGNQQNEKADKNEQRRKVCYYYLWFPPLHQNCGAHNTGLSMQDICWF